MQKNNSKSAPRRWSWGTFFLTIPYVIWMAVFILIPLGVVRLVMLPMCMSFLLRTLAWVGLLRDTGIINQFLGLFGIGPLPLIRTTGAVILGMVYNYLPYMILPLYTVIMKIDPLLIEAAEDLGCSSRHVFARVILPLSMPGIISGITIAGCVSLI